MNESRYSPVDGAPVPVLLANEDIILTPGDRARLEDKIEARVRSQIAAEIRATADLSYGMYREVREHCARIAEGSER